nr:carbonic anhydrase [Microbacterium sp. UBA837]
MSVLSEVLEANESYASAFDKGDLALPPARGFAILTCMDARLDPAKYAGLSEGDAHVIRNAGGRASDDAIRSLVISYKLLATKEWFVIHHTDCGMEGGFNRSSQHLDRGGVQDGNGRLEQEDQRCSGEAAPAVARGPGLASGDALPGAAGSVAGGATPGLAHDRNRRHDSGSVVSDRRVGPGRHPLVSSRWRHAPDLTGRAHRPISVVRGA